ncbi:uncharacterized protein C6orf118-like [Halichoeres trimaculatus]|uniref:uncharacterized protein C6orf118-like n=1 Tax=Halichoeres trimaculatus TaxID=147232 RepID=UPI003D9E84F0
MSSSCKPKKEYFGSKAGEKADILTSSSGHLGPHSPNQRQPQREVTKSFQRSSRGNKGASDSLQKPQPHVKKKEMTKPPVAPSSCKTLGESEVTKSRKDQIDFSLHEDKRDEGVNLPETVYPPENSLHVQKEATRGKQTIHLGHSNLKCLKDEGQIKMKQQFDGQDIKQEFWTGINVAEKHERKLKKELQKLSEQRGPSRDRLAVFSDVFDDVCEGSPVFGRILREIKTDYDLYVNHLMASQSQDMSPEASLEDVSSSKVREKQLKDAEEEVCRLEQEVRGALEENTRARNDLRQAEAREALEEGDTTNPSLSELRDRGTDISCTDNVQTRRLQVLSMWREIQLLEEEMKEKLVPAVAITATERCTKDVKTEIMRLIATNHRLKAANKDLENSISAVLDREKANKAARRILWEEVHCDLQTD